VSHNSIWMRGGIFAFPLSVFSSLFQRFFAYPRLSGQASIVFAC
jgi:hypothetical protein